ERAAFLARAHAGRIALGGEVGDATMRGGDAAAFALDNAVNEGLALHAELVAPAAVEMVEHIFIGLRQIECAGHDAVEVQRFLALIADLDTARNETSRFNGAVNQRNAGAMKAVADGEAQGFA